MKTIWILTSITEGLDARSVNIERAYTSEDLAQQALNIEAEEYPNIQFLIEEVELVGFN